jgi:hypothetical protein
MATQIKLSDVVVDVSFQPRVGGIDPAHVQFLQEIADELKPITVVRRGTELLLVDGFHRLAALQNLGREVVSVEEVSSPVDGDLHRLAFTLNGSHGRPLSLDDRRTEAARVLNIDPTSSDREVGRHCGLSQPTVAKIRSELEASAQISQTSTRVGKGGYRYQVDQRREADEAGGLWRNFERFVNYVVAANESDWWDDAALTQMLLDRYEEDQYGDILEGLQGLAKPLNDLFDAFRSALK